MKLTVLFLDDTVIVYDNIVSISYSHFHTGCLTISMGGCFDHIFLMDVFTFDIS